MASYFSPDLFLDKIQVVVVFLEDGHISVVRDYDSHGRCHESGDLLQMQRGPGEQTEPAVILGWGECEGDAVKQSRQYFRRLAKWHGHKADISQFQFMGYDLAGSEIFHDVQYDSDSSQASGESSDREQTSESSEVPIAEQGTHQMPPKRKLNNDSEGAEGRPFKRFSRDRS